MCNRFYNVFNNYCHVINKSHYQRRCVLSPLYVSDKKNLSLKMSGYMHYFIAFLKNKFLKLIPNKNIIFDVLSDFINCYIIIINTQDDLYAEILTYRKLNIKFNPS